MKKMKEFLLFVLCCSLICSLCACNSNNVTDGDNTNSSPTPEISSSTPNNSPEEPQSSSDIVSPDNQFDQPSEEPDSPNEENLLMDKDYPELSWNGDITKLALYELVQDMTPAASDNIPLQEFLDLHKTEIYNEHIKMVNLDDYEEYFEYLFMINKQIVDYNPDNIPENLQPAWKKVVDYANYLLDTWDEIVKSDNAPILIDAFAEEGSNLANEVLDEVDLCEDTYNDISLGSTVATDTFEFTVANVDLVSKYGYQIPADGMVFADIVCQVKNIDTEELWLRVWSSMTIIYAGKYAYNVNPLSQYIDVDADLYVQPLQTTSVNWLVEIPEETISSTESLVLQFTLNDGTNYQIQIR